MTVGQLAKKMQTTVRTLQYYDREGLLPPSSASDGGRRLYTDRDVVRLHHIQSMKYLGFSLDDIKHRLPALNSPREVAAALEEQAASVREQIAALTQALDATEKLRALTLGMERVDWDKYADIVVLLRMGNEHYGVVTQFGDRMMERVRGLDAENGPRLYQTYRRLVDEAAELPRAGVTPQSERGQIFAKAFWDYVTEFTGGDMALLPEVIQMSGKMDAMGGDWGDQWAKARPFVEQALAVYFQNMGFNPLKEAET
jgi:DNA-binding transcriptional MerR regulator